MAVKGSKFTPMRVKPHRPLGRVLRWVGFSLLFFLAVLGGYAAGVYGFKKDRDIHEAQFREQCQESAGSLAQELTQLRTTIDIDRQSMEELRQLAMTQKAQLNAAERDLRVYKDLLSPNVKTNPLGISIGVFTVTAQQAPGHYSYSLTLQKLSAKETEFKGFLEFRIVGLQGGNSLQLSLYQVATEVAGPSIPISLKYFYTLAGELKLPLNFIPQSVELVVKSVDQKNPPLLSFELDWPASAVKP